MTLPSLFLLASQYKWSVDPRLAFDTIDTTINFSPAGLLQAHVRKEEHILCNFNPLKLEDWKKTLILSEPTTRSVLILTGEDISNAGTGTAAPPSPLQLKPTITSRSVKFWTEEADEMISWLWRS